MEENFPRGKGDNIGLRSKSSSLSKKEVVRNGSSINNHGNGGGKRKRGMAEILSPPQADFLFGIPKKKAKNSVDTGKVHNLSSEKLQKREGEASRISEVRLNLMYVVGREGKAN